MFMLRKKRPLFLLTICLLAGFIAVASQAQVTSGEEELLSTTGESPAIDANGRNGFVSAWTETQEPSLEIFGSLIPSDGGSPGAPFQVNTRVAGFQVDPSVAVSPGGGFMVVWQGGTFAEPSPGDGDHEGIFGQAFGRDGAKLGPQRRLNERTTGPQVRPQVAAQENGTYVVVWEDEGTLRNAITARLFSATGAPLGPERRMSADGEYNVGGLVAAYPGGFAVTWEEGVECSGGRPDGRRLALARFDPSGRRAGKVLRSGSLSCGEFVGASAMAGSKAGAVVVLRDEQGYSVQRIGPAGEIVGQPVPIATKLCPGSQCGFINRISMDDFGRFALVWEVTEITQRYSVQVFNPRGKAITGRVPAGLSLSASSSSPVVALANDGSIAFVWRREAVGSPGQGGLFLRRLQLP